MQHLLQKNRHALRCAIILVSTVASLLWVPVRAMAVEPEVQRDVLVLIRALAYDRNLAKRAGSTITVGVLYQGSSPTGEAEDVLAIITALKDVKVGGLGLNPVAIALTDREALQTSVSEHSVNALFVPSEYASAAKMVTEVTRAADISSLTRNRALIDAGISLGVISSEGQPRITVNLPAAKEEGASFGADLLRLAEVVR